MQIKNRRYKATGNKGLFDEQEIYQKLSSIGNPLEKISKRKFKMQVRQCYQI